MIQFIDDNKENYSIESICRTLPIATSSYYRHKDIEAEPYKRSQRAQHDEHFKQLIMQTYKDSKSRYGVRKIWESLKQQGYTVGRGRIERLMKELGIQGIKRGRFKITTRSKPEQHRAEDLVKRDFTASYPNQLWVADFTYVQTK